MLVTFWRTPRNMLFFVLGQGVTSFWRGRGRKGTKPSLYWRQSIETLFVRKSIYRLDFALANSPSHKVTMSCCSQRFIHKIPRANDMLFWTFINPKLDAVWRAAGCWPLSYHQHCTALRWWSHPRPAQRAATCVRAHYLCYVLCWHDGKIVRQQGGTWWITSSSVILS